MIKNMRILAALLFCLTASLVAPPAGAQTGGTYWRLDRSAGLPYRLQFKVNADGPWNNLGEVDATGLFSFTGTINSDTTLSGSGTGQTYQHSILVRDGAHLNPNGNAYGLYVRMLGRDPASTGFRFAFGAQCQWDTPGDPLSTPGHNGCAGQLAQGILNYPNTGPGAAAVLPGIWGDNWNVVATAKANNASSVIAGEADVSVYGPNLAGDPGATYLQRKGIAVVLIGDGPQGSVRDAGIGFIAVPGVTPFKHLFAFDKTSGGQPIATDGTIIGVTAGSPAMNVANGVDFEYGLIFSGYPFKSKDFYVNADGHVSASNLATKGVVSFLQAAAPANQKLSWIITDPATGALKFQALSDDGLTRTTWLTLTKGASGAAAAAFEKKVYTPPSTAALAGFNIPPGDPPSGTWQDGDLVTTTSNLLVRLNGVTKTLSKLEDAETHSGLKTFTPGIVLPHGAAPGAPPDGQFWTTEGGLFGRINGAIKRYANLQDAQTWSLLQTFNGGVTVNGGTLTSSAPVVFGQTWNSPPPTQFIALSIDVVDTNSDPSSLLLRARLGGVDKFSVRKDGLTSVVGVAASSYGIFPNIYGGSGTAGALNLISTNGAGLTDTVNIYTASLQKRWSWNNGGHFIPNGGNNFNIGDATNTVSKIYLVDLYSGANKVLGARITGWGAVSGAISRAAYPTYAAATISNPPTQAEVQAIADALQALSRDHGALRTDITAHGLIGN